MKVLIVDNEAILRKTLKDLLNAFCPQVIEIDEADGVIHGLEKIATYKPDVVMLDVEMDDGTGFDLMKQVPNPNFQLIFVTAHNKYATDAFKFYAIDYLLKPVDPDALQISINRAASQIKNQDLGKQMNLLINQINGKYDGNQKIVLRDIDNVYFVKISDILYCKAEGPYTHFILNEGNPILVSQNLKEYETILEPIGFVRTHHSYLVNTDKIKLFDKSDGGFLCLENNHTVPVSQRKKDVVLSLLEARLLHR